MATRGFRLLATAMIVYGASIALPAAASGAITLGPPDLNVAANVGVPCSEGAQTGTCSNIALAGGALAQSPIDGVVVRWRARSNSLPPGNFAPTFRIVRSAPNGFAGAGSSGPVPAYGGVGEFPTQLSIRKDDYIGIDLPVKINTCGPCVAAVSGGGTEARWRPALIDNEPPGRPPDAGGGNALLINADVEPDTDGDGFGDETQDKCTGSGGSQDACSATSGTEAGCRATRLAEWIDQPGRARPGSISCSSPRPKRAVQTRPARSTFPARARRTGCLPPRPASLQAQRRG